MFEAPQAEVYGRGGLAGQSSMPAPTPDATSTLVQSVGGAWMGDTPWLAVETLAAAFAKGHPAVRSIEPIRPGPVRAASRPGADTLVSVREAFLE